MNNHDLNQRLVEKLGSRITALTTLCNEVTLEIDPDDMIGVTEILRDEPSLCFQVLIDVIGVDYLHYGKSEWLTNSATATGFDRASHATETFEHLAWKKPRFSLTYHLLSVQHNHRLRLTVFPKGYTTLESGEKMLSVESLTHLWPSANWHEREVFDLMGIYFNNHSDLRRILTDYHFEGHPLRKDFPLIGEHEVRYDAAQEKVIREPVSSVIPRTVIPKVIRLETECASNDFETNSSHDK